MLGLKKIENRILEIKNTLNDETRRKNMARGVAMPIFEGRLSEANRPLLGELEELQVKRGFIHDNRNLWINLLTILLALFIAFVVPSYERKHEERSDIQSLYQTIVANEDIFISNDNDIRNAQNNNAALRPPESYIDFRIENNVHKILQREMGIAQYRFLLYFLGQTQFLNQQISVLKDSAVEHGKLPLENVNVKNYISTVESLEIDGWENSKLEHITDSNCILYLLQRSFPYLKLAQREKYMECPNDSLNRLFYHYGYYPDETPSWLVPLLRSALNERSPGMGDKHILDPKKYGELY